MKKNQILAAIKTLTGKNDLSNITNNDVTQMNDSACSQFSPFDSDDDNPIFILDTVSNDLLALIADGKINLQQLASITLARRGYDLDGKWVGFKG